MQELTSKYVSNLGLCTQTLTEPKILNFVWCKANSLEHTVGIVIALGNCLFLIKDGHWEIAWSFGVHVYELSGIESLYSYFKPGYIIQTMLF